jgi:hypothetical protein
MMQPNESLAALDVLVGELGTEARFEDMPPAEPTPASCSSGGPADSSSSSAGRSRYRKRQVEWR